MKLRKELATALIAVLVFTVLLGVAYPLAMTAVAQVAFPGRANGSELRAGGRVVGSRLLARPLVGARYFQPRPSQTGYSASASAFSNRGPNQVSARAFYAKELASYLARESRYSPGLTKAGVPVDAVTTSASGLDPQISITNAGIQAHRIAAVRRMPLARVGQLIAGHTDGRFLGLFGERGVNVLELNLALDADASR
jgi:K+-transporting ATPase ATPase C chain